MICLIACGFEPHLVYKYALSPLGGGGNDYSIIWIYLVFGFVLSGLIITLSYILAEQIPDSEKLSEYECGFVAMTETRSKFEIRFFLVAILFIIFDLEIALIIPITLVLSSIELIGFTTALIFVVVLLVGLIFEICSGALEWQ